MNNRVRLEASTRRRGSMGRERGRALLQGSMSTHIFSRRGDLPAAPCEAAGHGLGVAASGLGLEFGAIWLVSRSCDKVSGKSPR